MYTHAVHRDYGAALVLINTDIVVSIIHNFVVLHIPLLYH